MIALYCARATQVHRFVSALASDEQVNVLSDWRAFERLATRARCVVVVIEWLYADASFTHLLALKQRLPLLPVVLITQRDPDNLRHLKDIFVEDVVWCNATPQTLARAVRHACSSVLLCRLTSAIERSSHLPPSLRLALAFACRSDVPPHSVAALATIAKCDRRTLWRQWRKGCDLCARLRLEDLLRWVVLLRATGLKVPGVSWASVATQLGVHEHTLARASRALMDLTLGELAATTQQDVLQQFAINVAALVGSNGYEEICRGYCGQASSKASAL